LALAEQRHHQTTLPVETDQILFSITSLQLVVAEALEISELMEWLVDRAVVAHKRQPLAALAHLGKGMLADIVMAQIPTLVVAAVVLALLVATQRKMLEETVGLGCPTIGQARLDFLLAGEVAAVITALGGLEVMAGEETEVTTVEVETPEPLALQIQVAVEAVVK